MSGKYIQYNISKGDIFKPENYFHKLDLRNNQALFIKMDRGSFKESPFLDNRIKCVSNVSNAVNLESEFLDNLISTNQYPVRVFIFHIAYCCSTLLSRAVDVSNKTLVYREPVSLHQLAVIQRRKEQFASYYIDHWWQYLNFTLQMLSKTWSEHQVPIIKATDSCNNIISNVMKASENSTAILLYSKLKDFIASNLKSKGRRDFLKNFVTRSTKDAKRFSIFDSIDPASLDDAKSATFVWMVQIMLYQDAVTKNAIQCKTLDAEKLLNDPFNKLVAVNKYLDLKLTSDEIKIIINGPAWNKHAKNISNVTYSSKDRKNEKSKVLEQNSFQVEEAVKWSQSFNDWNLSVLKLEEASL